MAIVTSSVSSFRPRCIYPFFEPSAEGTDRHDYPRICISFLSVLVHLSSSTFYTGNFPCVFWYFKQLCVRLSKDMFLA